VDIRPRALWPTSTTCRQTVKVDRFQIADDTPSGPKQR
jgi:hypothetical protein